MGESHQTVYVNHIIFQARRYSVFLWLRKRHQVVWTVSHQDDQYFFAHLPMGAGLGPWAGCTWIPKEPT